MSDDYVWDVESKGRGGGVHCKVSRDQREVLPAAAALVEVRRALGLMKIQQD